MIHKATFSVLAIAAIALAPLRLRAAPALHITSPANLAVVNPGQTIQVKVSVTGGAFGGVTVLAPDPIANIQEWQTKPPYEFAIAIPSRITPGLYALTAWGGATSGSRVFSDPVSIDVERPDSPETISIDLGPTLELAVGGQTAIRVFGKYADGSQVDLSRSTRTTYEEAPPGIVSVTKDGLITALSVGATKVIVDRQVVVRVVVGPSAR